MPAALASRICWRVISHSSGAPPIWSSRIVSGRPEISDMRRITMKSSSAVTSVMLASISPAPASFMPSAMASISGSWAEYPGVMRPSRARCLIVRAVVKPSAPASRPSLTRVFISSHSSTEGSSAWSAPRSPMT